MRKRDENTPQNAKNVQRFPKNTTQNGVQNGGI